MKVLILMLIAINLTGCYLYIPDTKPDTRTFEQLVNDDCKTYFNGPCNPDQRKQVIELRDKKFWQAMADYQDAIDKFNGTGKYAVVHAIEENTRTINNNLLWMRIENGMRR